MDTKLKIPAKIKDVLATLEDDLALHTATGWRLAAKLAAVVRLHGAPGRPEIRNSENYLSTVEVAKFGLRGLTSSNTVERYVKGWLDAHDGVYPDLGDTVTIPDGPFPPEDKNIGTRMPRTVDAAVDRLVERHGLNAVLDVLDELEARDEPASTSDTRSKPASTLDERWARWLTRMNTLMTTGARLADESEASGIVLGVYPAAGKALYETLIERRIDAELREMLKGGV